MKEPSICSIPRQLTVEERHPELFAKDLYIDPETRERTVPMQVLCFGYMRTGTACQSYPYEPPLSAKRTTNSASSAMQKAFNILGIPCCHSFSLFTHILDCTMWLRAFDAKFARKGKPFTRNDWDRLLADYGAVTDIPALAFWEDLVDAYPEAKAVLMERDIESWYKSFDDAVVPCMWGRFKDLIAYYERDFMGPIHDVHRRWATDWMGVHSAEEMRAAAKDRYREHYAAVRRTVPEERLLEYGLGSGWEPLCAFLGKSVQGVEFPKVNETASLHEKVAILTRRGAWKLLQRAALWLGLLLVGAFALWKAFWE